MKLPLVLILASILGIGTVHMPIVTYRSSLNKVRAEKIGMLIVLLYNNRRLEFTVCWNYQKERHLRKLNCWIKSAHLFHVSSIGTYCPKLQGTEFSFAFASLFHFRHVKKKNTKNICVLCFTIDNYIYLFKTIMHLLVVFLTSWTEPLK